MQNKIPDALSYCQRAYLLCASRMQKLTDEAETSKGESSGKDAQTNNVLEGDLHNGTLATSAVDDEVDVLKGLMSDLSDKVLCSEVYSFVRFIEVVNIELAKMFGIYRLKISRR